MSVKIGNSSFETLDEEIDIGSVKIKDIYSDNERIYPRQKKSYGWYPVKRFLIDIDNDFGGFRLPPPKPYDRNGMKLRFYLDDTFDPENMIWYSGHANYKIDLTTFGEDTYLEFESIKHPEAIYRRMFTGLPSSQIGVNPPIFDSGVYYYSYSGEVLKLKTNENNSFVMFNSQDYKHFYIMTVTINIDVTEQAAESNYYRGDILSCHNYTIYFINRINRNDDLTQIYDKRHEYTNDRYYNLKKRGYIQLSDCLKTKNSDRDFSSFSNIDGTVNYGLTTLLKTYFNNYNNHLSNRLNIPESNIFDVKSRATSNKAFFEALSGNLYRDSNYAPGMGNNIKPVLDYLSSCGLVKEGIGATITNIIFTQPDITDLHDVVWTDFLHAQEQVGFVEKRYSEDLNSFYSSFGGNFDGEFTDVTRREFLEEKTYGNSSDVPWYEPEQTYNQIMLNNYGFEDYFSYRRVPPSKECYSHVRTTYKEVEPLSFYR